MSTVRREKSRYTSIHNDLLRDANLSFGCRGMLGYLLAHPDDWECRVRDIEREGGIGTTARRTLMIEAEKAGYLSFSRIRKSNGQFFCTYTVREEPLPESERTQSWLNNSPDGDEPPPDGPSVETPNMEDMGDIPKTDLLNTDLRNTEVVVAESADTPPHPQPPKPTTTIGTDALKGEKPTAGAKPSAREAEPTACEILHSFVRRNNPHWSPTIHDQETINAKVPASELPAFSDFVSNWFLDYPNTRHASKILTAYAEQSAKRKLETERASQGANDLKELARRIEHSRQQDIKLANERRANRGNDQPVASGTARPASEPPPARRPYCLPESFVGTVWATPDARRDAVRMVEDQEGDELPDCFRPMGVRAQPVYTTVNA